MGREEQMMAKNFAPLDNIILSVSRELFLTIGIRQTEMKDIARVANIGRSTLYRHFGNKEQIAFYIAKDILIELMAPQHSPSDLENYNGFQKVKFGLDELMNRLLGNPEKVRFLNEFDQIFTDSYPEFQEAQEYVEFNKQRETLLHSYLEEGIGDGSIRNIQNPIMEADVIINIIMGVAQRVIPRANHYIEEHGFYKEFLQEAIRIIMLSIKP